VGKTPEVARHRDLGPRAVLFDLTIFPIYGIIRVVCVSGVLPCPGKGEVGVARAQLFKKGFPDKVLVSSPLSRVESSPQGRG
jgi:hypothetical protein